MAVLLHGPLRNRKNLVADHKGDPCGSGGNHEAIKPQNQIYYKFSITL
ncbi:hypothetical protein MUGA111182_19495 [Mucilaginibacter galii]